MDETLKKLDQLKRQLHPEKEFDLIEQCEIVAEALSEGSEFEDDKESVAHYLDMSENWVYKMRVIHDDALPELKEWLRGTAIQCHSAYKYASLTHEAQELFLDAEETLKRGYDSSSRTITTEEK